MTQHISDTREGACASAQNPTEQPKESQAMSEEMKPLSNEELDRLEASVKRGHFVIGVGGLTEKGVLALIAQARRTPPTTQGGEGLDREAVASAIRDQLTERWRDVESCRDWTEDVLLTGCRKVGGGKGYANPEEAAQNLALLAADAILALSAAPPAPASGEGESRAVGSREWWLVRNVATEPGSPAWYELTDADRAALSAPSPDHAALVGVPELIADLKQYAADWHARMGTVEVINRATDAITRLAAALHPSAEGGTSPRVAKDEGNA